MGEGNESLRPVDIENQRYESIMEGRQKGELLKDDYEYGRKMGWIEDAEYGKWNYDETRNSYYFEESDEKKE